jgi:hypothetical protein
MGVDGVCGLEPPLGRFAIFFENVLRKQVFTYIFM